MQFCQWEGTLLALAESKHTHLKSMKKVWLIMSSGMNGQISTRSRTMTTNSCKLNTFTGKPLVFDNALHHIWVVFKKREYGSEYTTDHLVHFQINGIWRAFTQWRVREHQIWQETRAARQTVPHLQNKKETQRQITVSRCTCTQGKQTGKDTYAPTLFQVFLISQTIYTTYRFKTLQVTKKLEIEYEKVVWNFFSAI